MAIIMMTLTVRIVQHLCRHSELFDLHNIRIIDQHQIKFGSMMLIPVHLLLITLCMGKEAPINGDILGSGILYPQESETREVKSLDGIWNFRLSDSDPLIGFRERWFTKDLSKSGTVIPMPVPSSYNDITMDRHIRDHVGLVWYDRTFFVPDSWRQLGYHVWLRFGSVHYAAQVWINGHLVMSHEIGHLPFQREVTSSLQFGKQNRVTVAVDNTLLQTTIPQGTLQELITLGNGEKCVKCSPAARSRNDSAEVIIKNKRQTKIKKGKKDMKGKKDKKNKKGKKTENQKKDSKNKEGKKSTKKKFEETVQKINNCENECKNMEQINNGSKTVQSYTFDFFNYAGIHRSVFLYTTPIVYIDDITVATDLKPDGTTGIIYYNITTGGLPSKGIAVTCVVDLLDKEGKYVVKKNRDADSNGLSGVIEIPNANLWWPYLMNPDPGYMYTLQVHLTQKEWGAEDIYRQPVGIRNLKWNSTSLLINGKPIYIRGFGRHEDSDIRGKGLDLPLVTRDYNLIKWIGANAYRTSHYPYAEEIMDFADQQGIMIIDECPGVDTENYSSVLRKKHTDSLSELIKRDKNRPSVIMWSIANEPRSQLRDADPYYRSISKFVKEVDKTRPVTAALNRWYSEDLAGQYLDIIGFNRYNAWYSNPGHTDIIRIRLEDEAAKWHAKYNKPVFMTEYGADTMPGLHIDPSYVWSEEYQVELMSEHFKAFDNLRKKGFFIGEMIWNFADFNTGQTTTRVGGNKKGIFTRQRQPKASAHHMRRRYMALAEELDGAKPPEDVDSYYAPIITTRTSVYRTEF